MSSKVAGDNLICGLRGMKRWYEAKRQRVQPIDLPSNWDSRSQKA